MNRSPKKANKPQVNSQRPITTRNAKRLANKNKDIGYAGHSKQMGRETKEKEGCGDRAGI